ncbi:MAG: NTP transferase domain-containing protein [Bacteriovorax sp.]|nr:NTP transferase domain-containing protein [Bacteriovorax sp.]
MQIDYALILSAGLGTRMGEVGKLIPKVLWPIYFKTMLELQIRYCEDLGIKKIYINTHFLHDEIVKFLAEANLSSSVTVLHEDSLLDSGGAIHNLAARPEINYTGRLLLVNGDQFLFFDKKFWNEAEDKILSSRAVLFGIKVDKLAAYNETIVENNQLVEIKAHTDKKNDYITYSGLGLLNLSGLTPTLGISRFFQTVADYKHEKVDFITPDSFEYWDFGTADIYTKNIFKLKSIKERDGLMGEFLKKHLAFKGKEELFINTTMKALDLERCGKFIVGCIQANGLFQKI